MSELPTHKRQGEPIVAVLLTWFLPGAGHFYAGRWLAGVLGLLLVEGLYALGWYLSDGRVFEFLDPELQGPIATVLTPETGNLGASIAQLRVVGFGEEASLSAFPPSVALGGILTSLSGILNLFLMVHVHLALRTPKDAPRAGLHPALLVGLTWALPGLGHLAQGRRFRGLFVLVMLVGLFLAGTWMAEGTNLSRERHFYYWSGQMLMGIPSILAELLSGRPAVTRIMPLGDAGLLFASMAGLLNILAMLDVFGVAERAWLGSGDAKASGAEEREVVA